jgi:transposase
MTKTYRDWSSDQCYLLPPSPRHWLPEGDLVYFLLDTVATLDLTPILAHYERELRGQPPFHPRMMVALLLYCYATGTRSSRRIMKRCHVDVACRVIVGEDIPDFRTISDFRKTHLARLEALFVEVLKLCALAGLAKVGTIALDGTKVKANASRHKAMSYDRMKEDEERLEGEIARLMVAPDLQGVLVTALGEGGWFDQSHESETLKAATMPDQEARLEAIRVLLSEETHLGMMVGVAVGWALKTELSKDEEKES